MNPCVTSGLGNDLRQNLMRMLLSGVDFLRRPARAGGAAQCPGMFGPALAKILAGVPEYLRPGKPNVLCGLNERMVLFCSISGQTANLCHETGGLGGRPKQSKTVRVFRHLFRTGPDIIAREIDMLPAKR
jgi:hypothetical protein